MCASVESKNIILQFVSNINPWNYEKHCFIENYSILYDVKYPNSCILNVNINEQNTNIRLLTTELGKHIANAVR